MATTIMTPYIAGLPLPPPLSLKFPSDSLSNTYHAGCRIEVRRIRIFLFSSDSVYESITYDPVKTRLLEGKKIPENPKKKNAPCKGENQKQSQPTYGVDAGT